MNTPLNGAQDFSVDSEKIAPAALSETRPLYWSIRRELWENRFIYLGPLLITAIVLFASLISVLIHMSETVRTLETLDPAKQQAIVKKPFSMAPAPIMLSTFVIGWFYCLDALYGERRDRSILFWKSLPVSDFTTVLSKASIPLVVLPLIAFVLSVITQVIMLFVSTILLLANGVNPVALWAEVRFIEGLPIMVYGLAVHALWFAPIFGWLLLISAWAKRATFLWALLPALAIAAVERIAFSTTYFMYMLQYRVTGAMKEAFSFTNTSGGDVDHISQLTPARFLTAPGLWVGLAFAAACLAMAVRVRRNREPI